MIPSEAEVVGALRVVAAFEAAARVDAAAGGLYWPDTHLPYSRAAIVAALRLLRGLVPDDDDASWSWRLMTLTRALGSYVDPGAAARLAHAAQAVRGGGELAPDLAAELRAALAREEALVEDLAVAPAPAA